MRLLRSQGAIYEQPLRRPRGSGARTRLVRHSHSGRRRRHADGSYRLASFAESRRPANGVCDSRLFGSEAIPRMPEVL